MNEIERIDIFDFSSESDTLIAHQFTENQNNNVSSGLHKGVDAEKTEDMADTSGQVEPLPQSSEPLEPERERKYGKYNMRKSIAWDSAFFTSAGVLDPDELSSMIKGVDKGRKPFLPGIEEDISKSIDSISTTESESLTLESIEADLFGDIRASIQKSSKAFKTTSSSRAAPGVTETQFICSPEKVNLASKNMMKSKPAFKKQTMGMQGPEKLMKQSSDSSQGTQPVARNGGLTSSFLKAPKVAPKPTSRLNPISSAPLKRASVGANQVKMENDKAKLSSGKVSTVSRVPGLGGSSRTVPKPALSLKSSSLSSSTATKKEPPRSSSSCDSSQSASSDKVGISPVKSNRRRIASRIINPISSSSTLKTPSKVALKKKEQARSTLSKLSSNTSPASSISGWSSVSSSSNSTVNQRSTSRVSIDTSSPCRSLDRDAPHLDFQNQSNDQTSIHENRVNQLPTGNVKKSSMQTGALSRPAMGKPSGLRMPSPKIGYFDGAKTVDRTPKGSMQSHYGIPAIAKIGVGISNPSGGLSKAKQLKLQKPATIGNMKLDSKKPASPVPSQKPSNASPKVSSVSGGGKKPPSISPKVHHKTDGESGLKAEKVGYEVPDKAEVNDVSDTGLGARKMGSVGVLKSEINFEKQDNTNLKDIKTASIEGDTCTSSSDINADNLKQSEEAGEDAVFSLQHLKNYLHSLDKGHEKENVHFEDQDGGLSMNVGAVDSKQQLQEELVGNNISQIDVTHPELSCSEDFSIPSEKEGSLICLSSVISEITASTRTPFAVKSSSVDGDLSSRLSIGKVKTETLPLSDSAQMENS
ncbi:TNF receptor-associated factor family protein [Actinidia chinensis var. chinensis]|uniref:TNF receptor-associated factor family protein n=1 Tax=Actinidia chinensis var. chinensis TaxID=1590841 RepID=A0A2R6R856_ACTCC|nr:TNF receptor-associated factor family protein [Actinidia chinensis var. chinensis]